MFQEMRDALERFFHDESVDMEERRERFKMCWKIASEFADVREEMAREVMEAFVEALKTSPDFKGYVIKAKAFLNGRGKLRVYKETWCVGKNRPVAFYSVEPHKNDFEGLFVGIRKGGDDDIPFEGDWRDDFCKLPNNLREILCDIWQAFGEAWDNSVEEWSKSSGRWSDWEWIISQHIFPRYYRMEGIYAYLFVLSFGAEWIGESYVQMFKTMKNATEGFLDALAAFYKRQAESR